MSAPIALLAAVSGYLLGSVPFALLVVRLFGEGESLRSTELLIPGSEETLRTDAVSATAVRLRLGSRYGCLTSLLDMAKAAAITLAFKLGYPGMPYFLISSGMAVVGHVWPVFHRFRGGRGQSPAIGGLFVLDWTAPLIAYPAAQFLGLVTRSRAYVGRFAPMLIAAAWLFLRFREIPYVFWGLGVFGVRVLAMRAEVRQYARLRRAGHLRTLGDELRFLGLGSELSRKLDRLRGLALKLKQRRRRES